MDVSDTADSTRGRTPAVRGTSATNNFPPGCAVVKEDPTCDWAIAKARIRTRVGEIPFLNWFEPTRQVERQGAEITIAVSDEPSRIYLEAEYGTLTRTVLAELGIHEIHLTLRHRDRVCSAKALSREAHQWLRAPARISSNGRSLNVNRARTVLAEHVIRPAR